MVQIIGVLIACAGSAAETLSTADEVARLTKQLDVKQPVATRRSAAKRLQVLAKQAEPAVPALKRSIKSDPDARVRENAVSALAVIVFHRKENRICPIEIIEAWEDKDAGVRSMARTYTSVYGKPDKKGRMISTYPQGAVEVFIRVARTADDESRAQAVLELGSLAAKNPKAMAALKQARNDRYWHVRHHTEIALYKATGDLDALLKHDVRMYVFLIDRQPISAEDAKKLSPEKQRDAALQELTLLSMPLSFGYDVRRQPKKVAGILLGELKHESTATRKRTVRFLHGVWAMAEIEWTTPAFGQGDLDSLLKNGKQKVKFKGRPGDWLKKHGLYKQLQTMSRNDPDESVRDTAAAAVARIDDGIERGKAKAKQ